jgi:hypothetical protein
MSGKRITVRVRSDVRLAIHHYVFHAFRYPGRTVLGDFRSMKNGITRAATRRIVQGVMRIKETTEFNDGEDQREKEEGDNGKLRQRLA